MKENENDQDEDINIDFSKIKNFFKSKKSDEKEISKESHENQSIETAEKKDKESNEDEDISIDFSKIKSFFKGKKEDVKSESHTKKEDEEEMNIDIKQVSKSVFDFVKKYQVVILILIPLILSIFFRMYPAYLPITDDWAQQSVYNNVKANIKSQVDQQYPNLPDTNKEVIVNSQFDKVLQESKDQIDAQIKATSDYFKSKMTDDNGQKYLSDIDTYLWYGEVKNYLKYGQFGDSVNNGKDWYSLRNGRLGREAESLRAPGTLVVHQYFEVFIYKIMSIFNKNINPMAACFYISVIIIALSIIPAFFIGRKLGGNVAGFFAGLIIALNQALLERTPAGVSDTDPWNIFFPLFITWMFIEAVESESNKKRIIFSCIGGILGGIFSRAWNGWWYPLLFIIATLGVSLIFHLIVSYISTKKISLSFFKSENVKKTIIIGLVFFIITSVSMILLNNFSEYWYGLFGPMLFMKIKDVGLSTLWPNVITTVAEFNVVPLSNIVASMGGNILFFVSLMGVVFLLFNRKKIDSVNIIYLVFSLVYYVVMLFFRDSLNSPTKFIIFASIPLIIGIIKVIYLKEHESIDITASVLIMFWFVGTAYSFTKGVRFAILMVPAFAIAFGIAIGILYKHLSAWLSNGLSLNKYLSRAIIIVLALILFIQPIKTADSIAKQQIPLISDEWYDSLIDIKNNSTDAIITSWWDFGHWFVSIAERRVTFDGADQGERIHWVGKSLLTSDEDVAMGILRMLNCGQQKAPHVLESYVDNDTVKAIDIINRIITQDKKTAYSTLKKEGLKDNEINDVLNLTHCDDLIPNYYITSEDMIGKAGVWAHFGAWDFKKAEMYNKVSKMASSEGIDYLTKKYNMSSEEANKIYYEIQSTDGDHWISPWPGYMGTYSSSIDNNQVICSNGIKVNLTDYTVSIPTQQGLMNPASLVYATKEDLVEKKFTDNTVQVSLVLVPDQKSYTCMLTDPLLAKSMFTRLFFFDGHGSQHFKLFSDKTTFRNERIIVWKVNWEPGKKNIMNELIEKTDVKKGDEVSLDYIGWTKENGIFDSSIIGWRDLNITSKTGLGDYKNNDLTFTVGSGQVIPGFDKAVIGMKIKEVKTIEIPPEEAYGTDPAAHPLGNKTLFFKIKVTDIN